MKGSDIKGVIPAMITPFKRDESFDIEGMKRLTHLLLEAGVHGLFPLGSIGEGPKMNREMRSQVLKAVVDAAGSNIKIIPGAGGITTKETIQYVQDAANLGASAAIIHPLWYYPPSAETLLIHYTTIADKSDIPIILYNLPSFVGYELPKTVVAKAAEHENIIGIKDSSGNLLYYQDLIRITPKKFNVIQGYGALFLQSLILGGTATLSGEANLTAKILVELYNAYLQGNFEKARHLHFKVVTLLSVITYGTFPGGVKEAMNMMGMPGGYILAPEYPLTNEEKEKIKKALIEIELLKA